MTFHRQEDQDSADREDRQAGQHESRPRRTQPGGETDPGHDRNDDEIDQPVTGLPVGAIAPRIEKSLELIDMLILGSRDWIRQGTGDEALSATRGTRQRWHQRDDQPVS